MQKAHETFHSANGKRQVLIVDDELIKHAYVDAVAELNTKIDGAAADPFAVAVCDVNGLKAINDTLGHQAGDKLIREASMLICNTFKHSPVYRVGGDEFVVILIGQD